MADSLKKPYILHVEDNVGFQSVFCLWFDKYFDIKTVESGHEALGALAEETFDAVVTDYEMPEMNGLGLLRKIKESYPEIPVIFLTGQGNEDVAREAFISGAADYFTKDFTSFVFKEKVVNSVNNAISKKKADEEKHRAEKILAENEERYRLLAENASDIIWTISPDGKYVYISPSLEKMTGYTPQELIGKNYTDNLTPDSARKAGDVISGVLSKPPQERQRTCEIELCFIKKDNSIIDIEVHLTFNYSDSGELTGLQGITRDITQRKKVENALEEQNYVLTQLNKISLDLASLPMGNGLFEYLTKKLKEITQASTVSFSEYDPIEKNLSIKYIDDKSGIISHLIKLTGLDILNLKSPVSEEDYLKITSVAVGYRNNLKEVTFGAVPDQVSKFAERLGFARFIGIAYIYEGKLYGTSVLVFGKEQKLPPEQLLTSFASLAAVSLRRRQAEETMMESFKRCKKNP